jgi:hypothetical protein
MAADTANCAPWELIDDETPRDFWYVAALIVRSAEADHQAFREAHPEIFKKKTPALGNGVANAPIGTPE